MEKSQINNLSSHFKNLEDEEQNKPIVEEKRKRAKINKIENRHTTEKSMKHKFLFEKINKIDKTPARLTNKKTGEKFLLSV